MTPLKMLELSLFFILGLSFAKLLIDGNWIAAMWVVVTAIFASAASPCEDRNNA